MGGLLDHIGAFSCRESSSKRAAAGDLAKRFQQAAAFESERTIAGASEH
jgi:hypothetical protein